MHIGINMRLTARDVQHDTFVDDYFNRVIRPATRANWVASFPASPF